MKNLKRHTALLPALAALTLLATACAHDDFNLPQPPAGDAVSFRTQTLDDFVTRAAGATTHGTYAIQSMGIYAGYTADTWNESTHKCNTFFDNLHVSRTSDTSSWEYTDEKFWPGSGYLSFFAYAPHRDHTSYGTNKPTITVPSTGTPTLQYTIADSHDKQIDLLLATPQANQVKHDYVTLPLRHALTKIAFSARLANAPNAGTTTQITRIELKNLYGSGSVKMDGLNRQWAPLGTNDHHYTQEPDNGGINTVSLTDVYQPLTPATGYLFLLPQTLIEGDNTTGATVSITYKTTIGATLAEEKTFDLELAQAITQFNPGMAYNLMILIDNGVTFIVAPVPWDNTTVEADVKNRILNVSRIEANVYDGATTRIHFWSNQPKESVYVLLKGNLDSNDGSKKPTGAEYDVNTVFQLLGGKTGEVGSAADHTAYNLYYTGFTGTTSSGEGYIDVVHASNHTDLPHTDNFRHIWLTASGLTRNIRLNSQFKATTVTIPYVGTFHRWNQRGERILQWKDPRLSDTDSWTASVVDENNTGRDVLIDRFASPYYDTGELYTSNPIPAAAGDPELAPVTNLSKTVKGVGPRIYLRVGWNSNAGTDRTKTRYARIQISKDTDNSLLTTLYLRQGEEADFVMPYKANERDFAMKFSPFNLTATQIQSGALQVDVINNDRLNARFTDYPTQAGAHFQWANATYPRRAYSPISPTTAPPNWDVNVPPALNYWAPIKSNHESCPPGYRRPGDGSITENSGSTVEGSEMRQSLWYIPQSGNNNNNIENSVWGYYADGYFDRRIITDPIVIETGNRNLLTAVSANNVRAAYIGRLFFNPGNSASLFFPAAGARPSDSGELQSLGLFGDYLTTANPNSATSDRNYMITSPTEAMMSSGKATYAHSIRCVRDLIFTTTLPPYNETGVPTALAFNATANAGAVPPVYVDAGFVAKWHNIMARDFRLYTEPDGTGNNVIRKIAAKVTFRGTTQTGSQDVYTDTYASLLGKKDSSVTYDFSSSTLIWTGGTTFNFDVPEGWEAKLYNATGTLLSTVTGSANIPSPTISLAAKGRVVLTRTTTAPTTP